MRPIELSVAGLHSFRERQTVDFSTLCDGGVFGIFGPTGSGKSSLLDAMTLALYGKVERASSGTQGILNHGEDELSVSFTFELGTDAPKRYRVERVYKRSKTDGLAIGSCRLLDFDTGKPRVRADKERDVSQQVKALIGLTHDDFTRAVVLPQGKFAEFLSLKGVERRRMLQRLFQLEKYGDRLAAVINGRLTEAKGRLAAIDAEQQGLGDASTEALQIAEKAYEAAKKEADTLAVKFTQMQKAYGLAKQQRDWQEAIENLKIEHADLQKEAPSIDEQREKIKRANAASRVLPFVQEQEAATNAARRAEREMQSANEAFDKAAKDEATAAKTFETLKALLSERAPDFERRRGAYQMGLRIESNLNNQKQRKSELEKQRKKLETEQKQMAERLSKINEDYQKHREQLLASREAVKQTVVAADERHKVQEALAKKQAIISHEKMLEEQREEAATIKNALAEASKKIQTAKDKQKRTFYDLRALFSSYEKRYSHIATLAKSLESLSHWLEEKERETERLLEETHQFRLAQELAQGLKEGDPCPVCGAIHHPAPATNSADHSSAELKETGALYHRCQEWTQKALNNAYSHMQAIEHRVEQIAEQSKTLVPRLPKITEPEPLNLAEWRIEDLKAWITEAARELKAVKQDMIVLDEKLKPCLKDFREHAESILRLETEKGSQVEHERAALIKWQKSKEEVASLRKKWDEAFPSFDFDQVEKEAERIQALDRKAHEEQVAVDRLEKQLETLEDEKRIADRSQNESAQRLTEVRTSQSELDQSIISLEREIHGTVGVLDRTIEEALKQLESDWEDLRKREEAARLAYESSQQNRFEAEKRRLSSETTFREANRQAEEASERLLEQLKTMGFPHADAVRSAFMDETAIEEVEKRIKHYDQRLRDIQLEMERLETKLAGTNMTQEAFKAIEQDYITMEEARDQALEKRATASNIWQTIKEKHARYEKLNKEKAENEQLTDRLQKLQNVFRGNRFVEFMAEEQMAQISRDASDRLGALTRRRYAIEVDTTGGFVIRDDANGGVRRPVSSLSGGETFLTSLALALSLSSQIQLRGEVPLQFFFLDEGFGTLDQELLDTVITALEKLQTEQMAIGVISHVPELRERLGRKLFVEPAEPSGRGSRVHLVGI